MMDDYRKVPVRIGFWKLVGYVALISLSTFLIGFCLGGLIT